MTGDRAIDQGSEFPPCKRQKSHSINPNSYTRKRVMQNGHQKVQKRVLGVKIKDILSLMLV